MNYLETLAYIESLSPTLEKPSLARIAAFCGEHGEPQNRYPVFHVGGTNGKGSTVAILESLLRALGLRVGRFTGPHLLRWNERFHVDGQAIADDEFARIGSEVRELSHQFGRKHADLGPLTWFEYLSAMAFFYFFEGQVDVAIFEVGLGGRFDATNIVSNVACSAITSIDLDHTHILGETEPAIAFEKAGIFKPGVPAVTAAGGAALDTLRERAESIGTKLYVCSLPAQLSDTTGSIIEDGSWKRLMAQFSQASNKLTLLGEHQRQNALVAVSSLFLALKTCEQFRTVVDGGTGVNNLDFVRAFSEVYWPGRLQAIPQYEDVWMDGAHNPAGAKMLRRALDQLYPETPVHFVLGCFANKKAEPMLQALIRPGDQVHVSEAATRRATIAKEHLAAMAEAAGGKAYVYQSIPQAFLAAVNSRQAGQPVMASGSLATVKEVMIHLGWHRVEDGQADCQSIHDKLSTLTPAGA
jgi:dihydrofolate synthase/folylpolyglutamate synthase